MNSVFFAFGAIPSSALYIYFTPETNCRHGTSCPMIDVEQSKEVQKRATLGV
jgi:hypothetical protein